MGNVILTLLVLLLITLFMLLKTMGVFDSDEFSLGENSPGWQCQDKTAQNLQGGILVAGQCGYQVSVNLTQLKLV